MFLGVFTFMGNDFNLDEAGFSEFYSKVLSNTLSEIDEDYKTLKQIYKLFKKNIPLRYRPYAIGYIMQFLKAKGIPEESRSRRFRAKKNDYRQRERRNTDYQEKQERNLLPEELSTTLFFGIGKNRKVFPKDILGLINQVANIDKTHVGTIKIREFYSFVQVLTEEADAIIQALNDYSYRGKLLKVSYSKSSGADFEQEENKTDEKSSEQTECEPEANIE